MTAHLRAGTVYALLTAVGLAAFLYPFWLPSEALPGEAHADLAPLLAAALGGLLVLAVGLEVRSGRMNGATVALLGVLSAATGLLRLLDLPGGGTGMFFLLVLAGAALGPRAGLLLGMSSMALSAVVTGGLGPWLPFQMLAAGWMGASAGVVGAATASWPLRGRLWTLAAAGWLWGFAYGAIMNLWSWPFTVGEGDLSWQPGLSLAETVSHYHRFYVSTSLAWDAAGALANAVLIVALGGPILASLTRVAHRLAPVVELEPMLDEAAPVWLASPRNDDITATRGKPVEVRR